MRPSLVQRAGGACLVLSGVVTLLFAMSLGAYAQAEEVAVRWMIEGQSERQPDYEAGTNPDGEGGRGTGDGSGDGKRAHCA